MNLRCLRTQAENSEQVSREFDGISGGSKRASAGFRGVPGMYQRVSGDLGSILSMLWGILRGSMGFLVFQGSQRVSVIFRDESGVFRRIYKDIPGNFRGISGSFKGYQKE